MAFRDWLSHTWNAFQYEERRSSQHYQDLGRGYSSRPDKKSLSYGHEKTIVTSIYNKLANDIASIKIRHVQLDTKERFLKEIPSGLNNVLKVEANIDQTPRQLIQDIAISMFEDGHVAVVPIVTNFDPNETEAYDIFDVRVGQILEWFPKHVRVRVYDDETGLKKDITVPKKYTAIIENPLYSVMNERNSTLKRLILKLQQLDAIDAQSSSGKLDIIVQLPYTVKTKSKKDQAEQRREDIETQLYGSKYGIAYIDGTEKITQLNRPAENNLMSQVEYLTDMLFKQLGLAPSIFDGTADEMTTLNYHNSSIEPGISAIVDQFHRTFLTKTARSQNKAVRWFRDPFKNVPVSNLADMGDKFTRNEILSSNEMRDVLGYAPDDNPRSDKLENKNINHKSETQTNDTKPKGDVDDNE